MKSRRKALLVVIASASVFVALVVLLAELILLPQAEASELEIMHTTLRRLTRKVEARAEWLRAQGSGYGDWGDAWRFAESRDPTFVEKAAAGRTMPNAGFDVLSFWDLEAKLIDGRRWDARADSLAPMKPETIAALEHVPQIFRPGVHKGVAGLVRTPSGLMFVVSSPILAGDSTGPSRGTVVVAQRWTQRHVNELAADEAFSVRLYPADGSAPPLRRARIFSPDYSASATSSDTLTGRVVLRGLDGSPAAVLEAIAPRPLRRQQIHSIGLMIAAMGCGVLVIGATIWWIIDRGFIRRLEALNRVVGGLHHGGSTAELEHFPGVDEVAELAHTTGSMAARLREAKKAAETADRTKSAFLATMSHEIRTPLNGVLGYTSLLRATPLSVEQAEMVTAIEMGGDTLLGVINEILDFSKLEAGKVVLENQPVHLRKLAKEVAQFVGPKVQEKKLAFRIALDPQLPAAVLGDTLRLRQILLNLTGNAVKFTTTGEVRLELGLAPADATGDLRLRFAVIDTGIGLTPEQRERLFQPFSQAETSTTRRFGGTGLGLAICSRLVAAMGGKFEVTSQPGTGSTFAFTFPAVACEVPAAGSEPPTERGPVDATWAKRQPLRILVAEDNAVNRRMLEAMLRRFGYTATFVPDGREACSAVLRSAYDLLLLDMQMPVMDGYAAARAIRERETETGAPRVRLVALTANALAGDRERCRIAGMDDYLSKPLRIEELARALDRGFAALNPIALETPIESAAR